MSLTHSPGHRDCPALLTICALRSSVILVFVCFTLISTRGESPSCGHARGKRKLQSVFYGANRRARCQSGPGFLRDLPNR